jgi:hypothetical protein
MVRVMVATATTWIFIALAAAVALILTAAAARAQGRRLERRMVAELGRRWDQRVQAFPVNVQGGGSAAAEGSAPAGTGGEPHRSDPDLQITLEELLSQRDVLLEEFQAVQAQISVLKKRVERDRPVVAVSDDNDDDEIVIQLNEVLPEEWAERRRR